MLPMLETLSLILIVTVAGFVQGLTGFGFGLIALPLLGFFIPFKTIIPLVLLLGLIINATLSVQLRKSVHLTTISTLFLITLPGIPIGAYILKQTSAEILSIILGIIMIAFTSYQLLVKPTQKVLGLPITLATGFTSGILAGSIGVGGPPVIIYSAIQPWSKNEVKGTLALYFLISSVLALLSQAYAGLITKEVIEYTLPAIPGLCLGIFCGIYAFKRISDKGYKKLAILLVFFLGWMMIAKNIFPL